jgi:WD40 repeat protein
LKKERHQIETVIITTGKVQELTMYKSLLSFFIILLTLLWMPAQAQENQPAPPLEVITVENAANIEQLAILGQGTLGHTVAWSPDGETIAVAGSIGVWLFNANNLEASPRLLEGHTGVVNVVTFSPDGRWLASGSQDRTVRIWDMNNETEHRILIGHESLVTALVFSPDGAKLASGEYGDRGNIHLWDMETGEQLAIIDDGCLFLPTEMDLEFSPNGDWLVCSSYMYEHWGSDGGISLWNSSTNEVIHTDFEVGDIVFTLDGHLLIDEFNSSNLSLYNIETLEEIPLDEWSETVGSYAIDGRLSPDTTRYAFVTGSTTLNIRYLASDTITSAHPLVKNYDVVFVAHNIIAVGGNGQIQLWDKQTFQLITTLPLEASSPRIASSPDGILLAATGDDQILVWNISDPQSVTLLTTLTGSASSLAFNSDGTLLASGHGWWGSEEETIIVIRNVVTGTEVRSLHCALALGGNILNLVLKRTNTTYSPKEQYWCDEGLGEVTSLEFSPDDIMLTMTRMYADAITIWDLSDETIQNAVFSPDIPNISSANTSTFSPDGHWLAIGSGWLLTGPMFEPLQLWEIGSDLPPEVFRIDENRMGRATFGVAFNPNGTLLAEVGQTFIEEHNVLHVWDVNAKELLVVLYGHTRLPEEVVFSPDGTLIATASNDGTVRLWGIVDSEE